MNKVEEQIVNTIEVICEACMPYICTYWEMEPTVRLKQCKPLRDWIDRIITDDLALIDREKKPLSLPDIDIHIWRDSLILFSTPYTNTYTN